VHKGHEALLISKVLLLLLSSAFRNREEDLLLLLLLLLRRCQNFCCRQLARHLSLSLVSLLCLPSFPRRDSAASGLKSRGKKPRNQKSDLKEQDDRAKADKAPCLRGQTCKCKTHARTHAHSLTLSLSLSHCGVCVSFCYMHNKRVTTYMMGCWQDFKTLWPQQKLV
jgi:hypothetical protein